MSRLGVAVVALSVGQACRAPEPVDTPLVFEVEGSGTPVVFVNGTGLDRRMWDEQERAFRRRWTTLRFDARGTGDTPVPSEPFDPRADLEDLLGQLGLAPVWLVGQSGGASFSIDFALEHPESVRGLVLAAPGVGGYDFPPDEFARFGRYAAASADQGHAESVALMLTDPYLEAAVEDPSLARKLAEIYLRNEDMWNPATIRLARPLAPPAIGRLREIRVPTLVVVGDRDLPHIRQIARLLHERIVDAELVTLPGAGHLVNMEVPREFNRIALEFLERHAAR